MTKQRETVTLTRGDRTIEIEIDGTHFLQYNPHRLGLPPVLHLGVHADRTDIWELLRDDEPLTATLRTAEEVTDYVECRVIERGMDDHGRMDFELVAERAETNPR